MSADSFVDTEPEQGLAVELLGSTPSQPYPLGEACAEPGTRNTAASDATTEA
jgi:hypothetical protein